MPVMHLVAGPHGAGKTSLYEYLIAPRYPALPFINPAAHAAEHLGHVEDEQQRALEARMWGDAERESLIRAGQSFVTETAFSHPSRIALMTHARSLGYEVVLYALAADDPRRLLQRVSQRVREGGHAVPTHKVLDRYPRAIENFRRAVRIAELVLLLDASDAGVGGPRLIASVVSGQVRLHGVLRPRWVDKVLGFAEA
jgi:predicted ABC-type ATPase